MVSRLALIVVDVQDGIANSIDGVPDADKIVPAIDSILRLTRLHNEIEICDPKSKDKVEIIFVQHDDKDPGDPLFRGKPTWELVFRPREKAKNERLVSKDVGNMFESNPDLVVSLRTQGIEHLVYVGLQTDYCVRASILGAIASGFKASKITLLRGAHSTYDNSSTGKSYQEVKEDVEKRLADLGVSLQDWNTFAL